MKLRPYHNPENIDESSVPDGWRFRYADEMGTRPNICGIWLHTFGWTPSVYYSGKNIRITYIVPVTP